MYQTSHRVIRVVNENTIQVNPRWEYLHSSGKFIQIFGLLPVEKNFQAEECKKLEKLILNKLVLIKNACYTTPGGTLVAIVLLGNEPLINYFMQTDNSEPVRVIARESFNRWQYPNDYRKTVKLNGGFPETWENPINKLPKGSAPYFKPIAYPTKKWAASYGYQKEFADNFFSERQFNYLNLAENLAKIDDPERDGDLIIEGERGIGKTWFISHFLMNLPEDKYDVIYIDMRHITRGKNLLRVLNEEIELFFDSYLLPDLIWCYPFFKNMYGKLFHPTDPEQRKAMVEYSLSLTNEDRNFKRLNYYTELVTKKLVICFDNIDQLSGYDQEVMVDYCRRLTGGKPNVRVLYVLRPETMILKSRETDVWGDTQNKIVEFRGTDVYDILSKRLTHNAFGQSWPLDSFIPGSSKYTYKNVLELYKESDYGWGIAGFVRGMSSTAKIKNGMILWGDKEKREEIMHKIDLRHYLQLFRRVLRSEYLKDFENIGSLYYGIQALMISKPGHMEESESYLFNLFDNERPELPGNALIRYRVLEYFELFPLADKTFDIFFDALGYGATNAREVLEKFVDADLVDIYIDQSTKQTIGKLTIPGKKHLEIVENLWYIICIKTGMNIYEEDILYNSDAINEASRFGFPQQLLEYYSIHGWVSERGFIEFIADQVALEVIRFHNFQEEKGESKEAKMVENMYRSVSKIHENLFDSMHKQLSNWENRARRNG